MAACVCVLTLTSYLADVQHVADDALSDVGGRLVPADLQGVRGHGFGREASWGIGQILTLRHGQAGAGLVGTGTVLGNALVDSLVFRANTGQSQSAVRTTYPTSKLLLLHCVGNVMVQQWKQVLNVLQLHLLCI